MTKRLSAILRLALVSVSLMASVIDANADKFTNTDLGGNLKDYKVKFDEWLKSGERVVINGYCGSGCAAVVVVIPRDRLCAIKGAALIYHGIMHYENNSLWPEANAWFLSVLPADFKSWMIKNRALESVQGKPMTGADLESRIQRCEEPLYSTPLAQPKDAKTKRIIEKIMLTR